MAQTKYKALQYKMQIFYLQPALDVYREIISSVRLKNAIGDLFDIWKMAVQHKYREWQIGAEPNLSIEFVNLVEKTLLKLRIQPNGILLDKVWYMFYATGELKYLKAAFETGGSASAPEHLRKIAIDYYQTAKEQCEYVMQEYGIKDSAFMELQKEIDICNSRLQNHDKEELEELFQKLKSASNVQPEPAPEYIDEKAEEGMNEEEKKKYREASRIFQDLANKHMNKISLRKKRS